MLFHWRWLARISASLPLGILGCGIVGCAPTYSGAKPPLPFVANTRLTEEPSSATSDENDARPARSTNATASGAAANGAGTELGANGANVELELPAVIRAVVLSDPRIRAALEDVEQVRADVITAGLLPNPILQADAVLFALPGSPFNAQTRQGGPPQIDIGLAYELDTILFGKRSAATTEAKRAVDVALADYADLARQRILDAIDAYFDVLEARELTRLVHQEFEQLERLQTITERRVVLGSVGQIELDRIRLATINGRRRVLSADAALDNARTKLRAKLGRTPFAARADARGTLDQTHPPAPIASDGVLELAEKNRPDLVSLRRQIDRAEASITTAKRNAWPTLSVSVNYTRQFQETAIGFPDANSVGGALAMSLPVFDRNQGNIAKAHAAVRQAEALLDAGLVDLRAEVEEALRSYRVAYETVTTFDVESLRTAEASRARIEEAYSLGGRTLLEVLDAQSAYREVFREHVNARAELLRAMHRVNAVVGSQVLR